MMNKADALFIRVTGAAMVLLLGIVGYYQRETNETIKENTRAQQRQEVEIKTNKAEVDGYCKVMDIKFFNIDERMAEIDDRIERVEKILRIENEHYTD
jgi:hypothetical protein